MGSSPLTRGKRDFVRDELGCVGLIPTHAGKTSSSHCTKITRRAHPRSHGENSPQKSFVSGVTGSSPLTQGKRRCIDPVPETVGFIPTHAGKTSSSSCITGLSPAHPHSRGENSAMLKHRDITGGSSPLTRGKLGVDALNTLDERLIPAHAGKTLTPTRGSTSTQAHPRSHGENYSASTRIATRLGSSPLTQGKPPPLWHARASFQLIPAHAGKTSSVRPRCIPSRAHPRSHGENDKNARSTASFSGSSPLTRGKLRAQQRSSALRGLIPTHAGKTGTGWGP